MKLCDLKEIIKEKCWVYFKGSIVDDCKISEIENNWLNEEVVNIGTDSDGMIEIYLSEGGRKF